MPITADPGAARTVLALKNQPEVMRLPVTAKARHRSWHFLLALSCSLVDKRDGTAERASHCPWYWRPQRSPQAAGRCRAGRPG